MNTCYNNSYSPSKQDDLQHCFSSTGFDEPCGESQVCLSEAGAQIPERFYLSTFSCCWNFLGGLGGKASTSRTGDQGIALHFSQLSHASHLKVGMLVAPLPGIVFLDVFVLFACVIYGPGPQH